MDLVILLRKSPVGILLSTLRNIYVFKEKSECT